jgi:hypothetical protein
MYCRTTIHQILKMLTSVERCTCSNASYDLKDIEWHKLSAMKSVAGWRAYCPLHSHDGRKLIATDDLVRAMMFKYLLTAKFLEV